MDMEFLTASHVSSTVALGLIRVMAQVDQRHFPGTLHKLIVINSPWIFQQIFGLVSSWLEPETAAVFKVLGDPLQEEGVREELLKDIHVNNLPKRYGGESMIGLPKLHYRLRHGCARCTEGEKEVIINSGEVVEVTVLLNGHWDKYFQNEMVNHRNNILTMPSLIIRSISFNVQVEVRVLKRVSDDIHVPLPLLASETFECQESVIRKEMQLNIGNITDGASNDSHSNEREIEIRSYYAIVLKFDHSAMWRQRTAYVELEGVEMPD
jgi:hypothetical protein